MPDRVGRIDAPREVAQPAFERAPHLLSHPPCGLPVTRASRRISPPKRMLTPRETMPTIARRLRSDGEFYTDLFT